MSLKTSDDDKEKMFQLYNESSKESRSRLMTTGSRKGKRVSTKIASKGFEVIIQPSRSRKPSHSMTLDTMLNKDHCKTSSKANHRGPSLDDSLSLLTSGTTDVHSIDGPVITTPFNDDVNKRRPTSPDLSVVSTDAYNSFDYIEKPVITGPGSATTSVECVRRERSESLGNDTALVRLSERNGQITNFGSEDPTEETDRRVRSNSSNDIELTQSSQRNESVKEMINSPLPSGNNKYSSLNLKDSRIQSLSQANNKAFLRRQHSDNYNILSTARKIRGSSIEEGESEEEDRMIKLALERSLRDVEAVQGQTEQAKRSISTPNLPARSLEAHLSSTTIKSSSGRPEFRKNLMNRQNSGRSLLTSGTEDVVTEVVLENHFGVSKKQISCRDLKKSPSTAIDRYNFNKSSEVQRSVDRNHMSHFRQERSKAFTNMNTSRVTTTQNGASGVAQSAFPGRRNQGDRKRAPTEKSIESVENLTGFSAFQKHSSFHHSKVTNLSLSPLPVPTKLFQKYDSEQYLSDDGLLNHSSDFSTRREVSPLRSNGRFAGTKTAKPVERDNIKMQESVQSNAADLIPKSDLADYKKDVMKLISPADGLKLSHILQNSHDHNESRKDEKKKKKKREKRNNKKDVSTRKNNKEGKKKSFFAYRKCGGTCNDADIASYKAVDDVIDKWFS
mmetsp:Transcript_576/g.889  ORF Transcript_576/g.889 Transcript_576/m.889 type:complete len:672 (-) Transcript_576:48-2063(-)|eukprot:CAMPEP_0194250562 /NCGR_PEP_ID=MMETSP0158-20130606/23387_1 /TAXON_ID=33649 /ORGANISM="Thalassionema nitzschioides, Strain L26-B" /LENGTH=671 /DNA_ID=CAMNT_0038987423 /DNA_START=100 /DNA_END=2115 /DNA_ORIENTATION=-